MVAELQLLLEVGAASTAPVDRDGDCLPREFAHILSILLRDLDHLEEPVLCGSILALGLTLEGAPAGQRLAADYLSHEPECWLSRSADLDDGEDSRSL